MSSETSDRNMSPTEGASVLAEGFLRRRALPPDEEEEEERGAAFLREEYVDRVFAEVEGNISVAGNAEDDLIPGCVSGTEGVAEGDGEGEGATVRAVVFTKGLVITAVAASSVPRNGSVGASADRSTCFCAFAVYTSAGPDARQ